MIREFWCWIKNERDKQPDPPEVLGWQAHELQAIGFIHKCGKMRQRYVVERCNEAWRAVDTERPYLIGYAYSKGGGMMLCENYQRNRAGSQNAEAC